MKQWSAVSEVWLCRGTLESVVALYANLDQSKTIDEFVELFLSFDLIGARSLTV
jgi:hypothetical protein